MEIEEVLTSFQGDDTVQFVELRMLDDGQTFLTDGAQLMVDDASGSTGTRRFFTFQNDVAVGLNGRRVLIATARLAQLTGLTPDFQLTDAFLPKLAGRVCYIGNDPNDGLQILDCVAYGTFTGSPGRFGRPTTLTPDNRSLVRVARTGSIRKDWDGATQPTPENNAGQIFTFNTLCGDGQISQGEQCDGNKQLGGQSCESLGFVKGKLKCSQCHFDTSACTLCGNDQIDGKEQCDGTDFGDRTCGTLGFTGGTLTCNDACALSTATCDPTFFVPGGAGGPDCLSEWQVQNAAARPDITGKASARQRCKDGDAGCDSDATTGQCTFTLAVCLDRADARVKKCPARAIESWTLLKPTADTGSPDAAFVGTVLGAVAALGTSTTADGTVTFSPALDATARCTSTFAVTVPTRGAKPGTRVVRARVAAQGGKPRDVDPLKLVCTP